MTPTHKRTLGALLLTVSTTAAGAAVLLLSPGPAFPAPRQLGTAHVGINAPSGTYIIDPMHTSLGFEIQHMGLSKVQGRFDDKAGQIVADFADPSKSSVTLTAQIASIDTNVAPRDADLKSDEFFDAAKYPTLTFTSSHIHKDGNHYVADGTLSMKGESHPVSIPFRYSGPVQDPFGGTRIGMVADPITISRKDYGITWDHKMPDGSPQLADDVTIRLSAEATLPKPNAAR